MKKIINFLLARKYWILMFMGILGLVWMLMDMFFPPSQILAAPTWRGITLGQTTREEVIDILGEPYRKDKCLPNDFVTYHNVYLRDEERYKSYLRDCESGDHEVFFYLESWPPDIESTFNIYHEIHLENGIVVLIVEDTRVISIIEGNDPIEVFRKKYGYPEYEAFSKRISNGIVDLYCEHGVMIHRTSPPIVWVIYIEPMSKARCISEFEYELSYWKNLYPDAGHSPTSAKSLEFERKVYFSFLLIFAVITVSFVFSFIYRIMKRKKRET